MNALELLRAIEENASPSWEVAFVHDAAPASKSRPRFSGRGAKARAYTPAESRASEDHLALSWRVALRGKTRDGAVAIACIFYRPNRQRIDADNMVKLVLDAGTKARAWHDDCQVMTIVARVELDAARPRTEIAMIASTSTLDREMFKTSTCPQCKRDFTRKTASYVSHRRYKGGTLRADHEISGGYCSNACLRASGYAMARCIHCGNEFRRKRAGQSLCSNKCKIETSPSREAAMVLAGKKPPAPRCQKCGGRVSRREYVQCAVCRGVGRPLGAKNKPVVGECPGAAITITAAPVEGEEQR